MAASTHIPILDCSGVGLTVKEDELTDDDVTRFGAEMKSAFASTGFCYLKNSGIDRELVDGFMRASRDFFTLPDDVKQHHAYSGTDKNFGWIAVERERINPARPGDLKEAFNYFPAHDDGNWPDVADFRRTTQLMYGACAALARRLCVCLSVGMGLDKGFMTAAHASIGSRENSTVLRTLYYPPIASDSVLKPGQVRLGEHSDYGTITLLFQDDVGGLEAELPGHGFVPVTPIPGTVLVNLGDLMQRWTADALTATRHRVLIPEVELKKRKLRQSVAFFIHPDDEYVIKPLDGSDKYAPISNKEYLMQKLNATY